MERAMTAQDKKWQAQEDARTLAESEEIKMDSKRLNMAKKAAKEMAKEQAKKVRAMQKIAGSKIIQSPKEKKKPVKKKESIGERINRKKSNSHNTFKRI